MIRTGVLVQRRHSIRVIKRAGVAPARKAHGLRVTPAEAARPEAVRKSSQWDDPLDVYSTARAGEVKRAMTKALTGLASGLSLSAVVRALDTRDAELIIAELSIDAALHGSGFDGPLATQLLASARREVAARGFVVDVTREAAQRYAAEIGSRLVVEVSSTTRQAIRDVMARALREGIHPYDAARILQNVVGLHSQYAMAVYNYQAGLLSADPPIAPARIAELVSSYYQRLLEARCETIARTEILSAANEGRLFGWLQAAGNGVFDASTAQKEWVAAADETTCPECGDLDGETVGMDDSFSDGSDMPPAHPNCRCTAALIVAGEQVGEEVGADI